MKKLLSLLCVSAVILLLCSCGDKAETKADNSSKANNSSTEIIMPDPFVSPVTAVTDDPVGFQLELPKDGEKIVVLETTKGTVKMRLFPEIAPKAVENFVELVESGYYDGITFHRVINNFMIQGGDPTATGRGGESIWGQKFNDEFSSNLLNLRGSVAYANSGSNTNGSQFFINQRKSSDTKKSYDFKNRYDQYYEEYIDDLKAMYDKYSAEQGEAFSSKYKDAEHYASCTISQFICQQLNSIIEDLVPEEVWQLYKENGGNINLDAAWKSVGGFTVFAQVFEGMDAVDSIATVNTDDNDKPLEDVIITKAYTETYKAQ